MKEISVGKPSRFMVASAAALLVATSCGGTAESVTGAGPTTTSAQITTSTTAATTTPTSTSTTKATTTAAPHESETPCSNGLIELEGLGGDTSADDLFEALERAGIDDTLDFSDRVALEVDSETSAIYTSIEVVPGGSNSALTALMWNGIPAAVLYSAGPEAPPAHEVALDLFDALYGPSALDRDELRPHLEEEVLDQVGGTGNDRWIETGDCSWQLTPTLSGGRASISIVPAVPSVDDVAKPHRHALDTLTTVGAQMAGGSNETDIACGLDGSPLGFESAEDFWTAQATQAEAVAELFGLPAALDVSSAEVLEGEGTFAAQLGNEWIGGTHMDGVPTSLVLFIKAEDGASFVQFITFASAVVDKAGPLDSPFESVVLSDLLLDVSEGEMVRTHQSAGCSWNISRGGEDPVNNPLIIVTVTADDESFSAEERQALSDVASAAVIETVLSDFG